MSIKAAEETLCALLTGVDLLTQQVARGNGEDPKVRGQWILLNTAIAKLQLDAASILSSSVTDDHGNKDEDQTKSSYQLSFKPVAPTPKGKLLQIIESLKRASNKKSPRRFRRSVSVQCSTPEPSKPMCPYVEALDVEGVASCHGNVSDNRMAMVVCEAWTSYKNNSTLAMTGGEAPVINKTPTTSKDSVSCNEDVPVIKNVSTSSQSSTTVTQHITSDNTNRDDNKQSLSVAVPPVKTSLIQSLIPPPPPPLPMVPPPPPPPPMVPPPPQLPPVVPPPSIGPPQPTQTVNRYVPKVPLKPLFWKRVQFSSAQLRTTDNVWKHISEPALEDMEVFVDCFAKKQVTTTTRPHQQADVQKPHPSAVRPITLLDGKRSQAVGILLRSLSCSVCEVSEAVRGGDVSLVDRETLQAVYDMQATKEELILINAHLKSTNPVPLDKPEMFLSELSKIPQFSDRLFCLLTSCSLPETHSSLQRKLHTLNKVTSQLHNSKEVGFILSIILALGNAMNNGNSVRGQADGFHIDILPKLKDVKTSNNTSNLLDYLVDYYISHREKAVLTDSFPLPEPTDLLTSSQMDFDQIQGEIGVLSQQLVQVRNCVKRVLKSSPQEVIEPFKTKMGSFLSQADHDVGELLSLWKVCQSEFDALVAYYCVATPIGQRSVDPAYFFGHWSVFVVQFHDCWKKAKKVLARERQRSDEVKRKNGAHVRPLSNTGLKSRLKTKKSSGGV